MDATGSVERQPVPVPLLRRPGGISHWPAAIQAAAGATLLDDRAWKLTILLMVLATGLTSWAFHLAELVLGVDNAMLYDFRFYYDAAVAYRHGEAIYGSGYLYAPIVLVPVLPLSYLEFWQAGMIMTLINVALVALTLRYVFRVLAHYSIEIRGERWLLVLGVFMFRPVIHNIVAGQMNILLMCLLTLVYYYTFCAPRRGTAGVLLATATVVKLWPAILLLLECFCSRARGLAARYVAAGALAGGLSLAAFGLTQHTRFIETLRDSQEPDVAPYDFLHPQFEQWPDPLSGWFHLLTKVAVAFGAPDSWAPLSIGFTGVSAAVVLLVLYQLRRSKAALGDDPRFDAVAFSILIVTVLLLSRFVQAYYIAFLVLPILLGTYVLPRDRTSRLLLLASVAGFAGWEHVLFLGKFLSGPPLSLVYIFNPADIGVLLFFAFAVHQLRRRRPATTEDSLTGKLAA